jgi:hypothetical protein
MLEPVKSWDVLSSFGLCLLVRCMRRRPPILRITNLKPPRRFPHAHSVHPTLTEASRNLILATAVGKGACAVCEVLGAQYFAPKLLQPID